VIYGDGRAHSIVLRLVKRGCLRELWNQIVYYIENNVALRHTQNAFQPCKRRD
jgi:hypothetical protein